MKNQNNVSTPLKTSDYEYPFILGGLASSGAACCTHPLDLVKVRLQVNVGKKVLYLVWVY